MREGVILETPQAPRSEEVPMISGEPMSREEWEEVRRQQLIQEACRLCVEPHEKRVRRNGSPAACSETAHLSGDFLHAVLPRRLSAAERR